MFVKRKLLGSFHRSQVRGQSNGGDQTGLGKHLPDHRTGLLSPASISVNTDGYGINWFLLEINENSKQELATQVSRPGLLFPNSPVTAGASRCPAQSSRLQQSLCSRICGPARLATAPRLPWRSGSWPCWGQVFMPVCNCAIPVTLKWAAPIFNLEGMLIS